MFDVFEKEKVAVIGMFAFLLLSILVRLILAYIYQDMIREAENMSTTNHKMLKQCKLKFSNCCKLNSGVLNTPIFVEKFLNRLALGRLPLDTVYHLSWQFMLLCSQELVFAVKSQKEVWWGRFCHFIFFV